MVPIVDDELVEAQMNNQVLKQDLHRANLAYYDMEEELKFHAAKAKELQEMVDCLSCKSASQVQQKLVEKSIQYAELNQVNDNLKYKLQEAERKNRLLEEEREATQEVLAELHGIVHCLQRRLDGSNSTEDEHLLMVENGDIITPKVQRRILQLENERDEYKQDCLKWKQEMDMNIVKGRDREVRNNLSLRSMKFQIDEAEENNELLSQKCEALAQVTEELEREKELQEEKIDALEIHFQMFNTTRLEGGIPQVPDEDTSLRDKNCRLPVVDASKDYIQNTKSQGQENNKDCQLVYPPSEETTKDYSTSRGHEKAVRDKPRDEAKEIAMYIHSGLSMLDSDSTFSTEIPSEESSSTETPFDSSTLSSRDALFERKERAAWHEDELYPSEEEHAWREDRLDLPEHIQPSSSYFHSGLNNNKQQQSSNYYSSDDTESTSSDTASLPSGVYGRIEI